MPEQVIIDALQASYLPVLAEPVDLASKSGLVIVDIVKGFASVGCGPLAPPVPNAQVSQMIVETGVLAKHFTTHDLPVLAFLDTHTPGKAEPPYPPHCEIGSGHEAFVDELAWLESESSVIKIRKDCINGYIGSISEDGTNRFQTWVTGHALTQIIVVGICTDICVMDFVLTTLSARNHGLLGALQDIVVYEKGCATYDLDLKTAQSLGLPKSAIHPQMLTHHTGLYNMASRGAMIASKIKF